MQAEFKISFSEKTSEEMPKINVRIHVRIIQVIACLVEKPYLWKGFHTMHINLSSAINIVKKFEENTEIKTKEPRILHSADFFHIMEMYITLLIFIK